MHAKGTMFIRHVDGGPDEYYITSVSQKENLETD